LRQREKQRTGGFRDSVLKIVASVPKGKLVSYGQVAMMAGHPRAARQVGWVLHGLPRGSKIPWQRVVNTNGYVPSKGREFEAMEQIARLRGEGIEVGDDGAMDLELYRWSGG
jgi:methylated-DNA-protein-cysteine methyltransferase-like protein